jgi:hypothetical protein
MKLFRNIFLLVLLLLLGACAQKQTPEEVAHGFWRAVVNNDLETARKLATKDSQDDLGLLDNQEKMLKSVEVGTATTTGTAATVPTTLIGDRNGSETRIELTTYLREEDEAWKVEGGKTVNALVTSSLETMLQNLTGDLADIGGALNKTITTGLREFLGSLQQSVPEIKQELGKLADEDKARDLGQELGALFSQGLREAMQEFSKGLEGLEKELQNSTQQQQEK